MNDARKKDILQSANHALQKYSLNDKNTIDIDTFVQINYNTPDTPNKHINNGKNKKGIIHKIKKKAGKAAGKKNDNNGSNNDTVQLSKIIAEFGEIIDDFKYSQSGLEPPNQIKINQNINNRTKISINWNISNKMTKKINNNDLRFQFKYKYQLLPMLHVLPNYVKKINDEANNNIGNLISLKTLELNNNKRECTLTLPENMSDEFKVDTQNESLYFKCKMRSVNHNLNIQSEWTPIHSQLLILDNSNYNRNDYSASEEKANMININANSKNNKNKNKVGVGIGVGAGAGVGGVVNRGGGSVVVINNINDNNSGVKYSAVFTNLGAMGRNGPKSLKNHYKGQQHQKHVKLTRNGIQLWTVPYNGRYNILCFGASGGDVAPTDMADLRLNGGKGAKVGGIFIFNKGDQIKILVGQQGMDCYKPAALAGGAGGGGGTFVVFSKNNEPIIIAAGGHGACYPSWKVDGIDGLAIEAESRDDVKKFGGIISNGQAGRGGSFKNDFVTFKSNKNCEKCNPMSFLSGNGIGGKKFDDYSCDGGFGGGGGSSYEGGGGGGYIGGLVAQSNQFTKKFENYGALSFNAAQQGRMMESGMNSGHGKVIIQYLG